MSDSKRINVNFSLPVTILKEGKYFVAYTPALDLSTSAVSFDEVKKRFEEVVKIFLQELMEKKTLNKVLSDLGWQRLQKTWSPPKIIANESATFNIPITT